MSDFVAINEMFLMFKWQDAYTRCCKYIKVKKTPNKLQANLLSGCQATSCHINI